MACVIDTNANNAQVAGYSRLASAASTPIDPKKAPTATKLLNTNAGKNNFCLATATSSKIPAVRKANSNMLARVGYSSSNVDISGALLPSNPKATHAHPRTISCE